MTLDELMECCGIMHDNGITGFCTNAGSTWPCRYWDNLAITMSENPDYANEIVSEKRTMERGHLFKTNGRNVSRYVRKGWLEKDVVTSNLFDSSLVDMAQGNIAFSADRILGASDVEGCRSGIGISKKESMGFAPFPYKNNVSADNPLYEDFWDLFMAVNKNSQNVELAKRIVCLFL